MKRSWSVALGTLVLLVAPFAAVSTSAARGARSAVPSRLVGTWGKTISAATWKKHGITYEQAGHWGFKVTAGGVSGIVQPPGKPDTAPRPATPPITGARRGTPSR
jgi:hypothetical protein